MLDTGGDEGFRTIGVVDVAGSMVDVENLAGLCHGAEKRVVASLPLLGAVIPDGGPFGPPAGTDHRAVEVQGHASLPQRTQPLHDQLAAKVPQLGDIVAIGGSQGAAHRGNIRQAAHAQNAVHHWVIAVVAAVPELPKPQHQMEDQPENDSRRIIGASRRPVAEAGPEALPQSEPHKQQLKQKQTRVGGQVLILKVQHGYGRGFTANLPSAKLHGERPPWVGCGVLDKRHFTSSGPLFQYICTVFLEVTKGEIYRQKAGLSKFNLDRASRSQMSFSYATGGLIETAGIIKANVEAILTGTPAVAPLDWGEDVLSLRLVSGMWLAIVLHELAHLRREDRRNGQDEELECDRLACEALLPDVETSIVDLLLGPAAGFMLLLIRGIHRPRASRTHPHAKDRIQHALLPRLQGAPDALWAFVGFVASLHLQAVSIEAVREHESFRSWFEHSISKTPELIERE